MRVLRSGCMILNKSWLTFLIQGDVYFIDCHVYACSVPGRMIQEILTIDELTFMLVL